MQAARMLLLLAVAALALSGVAYGLRPQPPATPQRLDTRVMSPAQQNAGLRFAPEVTAYDRQAVLAAISRARPEARRLIALVDGLTTVQVGPPPGGAMGTATVGGGRDPVVALDLGLAMRVGGQPAVDRLVLHELGHVVDHVLLVDERLSRELDADIEPGYACPEPGLNACAEPAERFAETFAKWATGDLGINLQMGYAAPPPRRGLEAWGRPLERLDAYR